jgi:quercetin dioxygenase-like cupin family protein
MTITHLLRTTALIAALAIGCASAPEASAGECPAGRAVAAGTGQGAGATMPEGVSDTVLAAIDLGSQPIGIDGRQFRLRKLVIAPGGVPWHSHEDRPAIIYVVQGEVTEYASTCAVPIVHVAGDVAAEDHAVSHWWKNSGNTIAVLLSADLLNVGDDPHVM